MEAILPSAEDHIGVLDGLLPTRECVQAIRSIATSGIAAVSTYLQTENSVLENGEEGGEEVEEEREEEVEEERQQGRSGAFECPRSKQHSRHPDQAPRRRLKTNPQTKPSILVVVVVNEQLQMTLVTSIPDTSIYWLQAYLRLSHMVK